MIEIGNDSGLSSCSLWAKTKISIGDRVKIGSDCILMDTDAHNLDYRIRGSEELFGRYSKDTYTANSAPIIIEDDVLIGTRCIIYKVSQLAQEVLLRLEASLQSQFLQTALLEAILRR